MPITANSRAMVASSSAVPTRMAPWRSWSRRSISPVQRKASASLGRSAKTRWLISLTSSSSVPYSGTSCLYMSDMAAENCARMLSGLTKSWAGIASFLVRFGRLHESWECTWLTSEKK